MSEHRNLLLSTQIDPYGPFDVNDVIIDVTPKSWFPQSSTRIKALYLFYFLAVVANAAGIIWPAIRYGSHTIFIDVIPIKFGWLFVYFSYWIQALQIIFFFYASFDLMMRLSPKSDTIHGVKERFYDSMFSLAFLNTIVFAAFIFPSRINQVGEQTVTAEIWALDFINNFTPLLMIIFETIIVHHRFAESLCRIIYEVFGPVFIYSCYVGFSYYAYHQYNEHWPYPYQTKLTQQGVILWYICGAIILIVGYIVAKALTKCLWSDKIQENPESIAYDGASFANYSVFNSFINDNNVVQNHMAMGTRNNNNQHAESLVVGSPYNNQPAYNGYGTIDQNKSYY